MLTHLQDLLNIHSRDEPFALFIELVETFLIPVTHTHTHTVIITIIFLFFLLGQTPIINDARVT